jgi:hypothetical protein
VTSFGLLLIAGLAACGGGEAARSPAAAKVGGIAELEALLKQGLGRGALVNVWATW